MCNKRPLTAGCAILLLGFALRVYRIDAVPLRGDEAFSLLSWTQPLSTVLRDIAPIDPQPPLAFVSLSFWVRLTGTSELAGRFYSVLWSILTIPPLYRIGRKLISDRVGKFAALLWAINPFQVWHAQDIRAYTLWPAFSTLAVWLLLVSVDSHRPWRRIAYIAATATAAYAFYLEGFLIIFHNIYAIPRLLRRKSRLLWHWLFSQIALGALLAPWYLQAPRLRSSGGYSGTADKLTTLTELVQAIPHTLRTLLFGETFPLTSPWQTLAATLALVCVLGGVVVATRRSRPSSVFLLTYAVIPLALFLTLSTVGTFYRPRYLNGATAAYTLAMATLIAYLCASHQTGYRWLAGILLTGVVGTSSIALVNYYYNPDFTKSPDWPALIEVIRESVRPEDMIIRNVPDPAFDYYYQGDAQSITLPTTPDAPLTETQDRLEAYLAENPRLWYIPTEHPVWDPDQTVATYLETHAQLVADTWAGEFRLQRWSPWQTPADEIPHPTDWRFDTAQLVGFDTVPVVGDGESLTLRPGQSVTLIAYWQPLNDSQKPYTIFTHLLGPAKPDGSTLWAGRDHPPQNGRVSTTSWSSESLLRDPYTITVPDDAPNGEYTLAIGMYEPESGERLPIANSQGEKGDSIPLVRIWVER